MLPDSKQVVEQVIERLSALKIEDNMCIVEVFGDQAKKVLRIL